MEKHILYMCSRCVSTLIFLLASDLVNPAHGPNGEGCCLTSKFGCCQDNISPAEVIWREITRKIVNVLRVRFSQTPLRTKMRLWAFGMDGKADWHLPSCSGARPGRLWWLRVHAVWLLPGRRYSCQRTRVRRMWMPGILFVATIRLP